MPDSRSESPRRRPLAARLWGGLDALRRALANLLLLALVVLLALAWWSTRPAALGERTTLVLELRGRLVEQSHDDVRSGAFGALGGALPAAPETRLRDLVAVIDRAAADPAVTQVLLLLDDFDGAGLPALREAAAALARLRAQHKTVYAWGSSYDQRRYFLAAQADRVWLHPMGEVAIEGYGGTRNYYKETFERIGVTAHVIRAGRFKSFGEPYTRTEPSPEALEEEKFVYDALWASYREGVERARKLAPGTLAALIDALPERLAAAGGDTARLALDAGLVDGLKTKDEVRAALAASGAPDEPSHSFRQVAFDDYLARVPAPARGDAVGVIVAEGEIVDGEAPSGRIGGVSTAALIRRARDDEHLKAIVLRIDSPGGSALGAELIRRELELTRAAGKPVVVSMGDVAASGGYWISLAADRVYADADTITGSIGVIALLPTAEGTVEKIGLHTGGYRTTWLAGAYDLRRPLDPRFERVVQLSVDSTYERFVGLAAAARKLEKPAVDAIAQGRIWTGRQAQERRLVDRTGSIADALADARERARLPAAAPFVYIEEAGGPLARLLAWARRAAAGAIRASLGDSLASPTAELAAWLRLAAPALGGADAARIAGSAPGRPSAHCLCSAP